MWRGIAGGSWRTSEVKSMIHKHKEEGGANLSLDISPPFLILNCVNSPYLSGPITVLPYMQPVLGLGWIYTRN